MKQHSLETVIFSPRMVLFGLLVVVLMCGGVYAGGAGLIHQFGQVFSTFPQAGPLTPSAARLSPGPILCTLPAASQAPATAEEGDRMVQCLADYVRDELSLSPAPGVSIRYAGVDPRGKRGFNPPSGVGDDTIEIFEQAFTNARRSEDVMGVVYEELWHSRQEHYIETHEEWHQGHGDEVWESPAPCGQNSDVCRAIEDSYGPLVYMTKYGPALEIQAKSAVLALEVAFSQDYVNHLKAGRAWYARMIEFAPGYFMEIERGWGEWTD